MESRGRGRARGRAREGGQPPAAGQQPQRCGGAAGRPGPPPQQPQQQQQQQPQQWARPPVPQQPQWVRPPMPTASASAGRGSRVGPGPEMEAAISGEVAGAGAGGDVRGGRSEVRGRSNRGEIMRTKPEKMVSKQGTSGAPIRLLANYFALETAGKWSLYQYRVDFAPDVDNTFARRGMYRSAMKDVINGFLFDGTMMFAPTRINPDPLEKFVQDKNGENIRITTRLVGDVAWGDRAYQQVFNIIIRKCLQVMEFKLIQRDYFDPKSKIAINEHRLELWPGFRTSIRQHENNILLNVDSTFKVLRVDNVYDMLMECGSRGGNVTKEFQSKIIGQTVMTFYNNKTYRIDDVDFNSTPKSRFKRRDGSEISYLEYFQQRHNLKISVENQPMLISRSKPREIRAGMAETVYLIPEFCQHTGITDAMRENFRLMRSIADHTRINPDKRIDQLMNFNRRMQECPAAVEELNRFGLKFAKQLVPLPGRVLPPENILAAGDARYSAGPKADWTRDLRNLAPVSYVPINELFIVCPGKIRQPCKAFMDALVKAASGLKMDYRNYKIEDIQDDRTHSYLDAIERIANRGSVTMIICVLPNQSSDRYAAIKKKCCVDRGIPTQVLVQRSISNPKGVMSIATKVAIQLNCKVGGAPWTIQMPMGGLMVVGYDVCRDTANKSKSFAAMVASLDRQLTRYYNFTLEHSCAEEISEGFSGFMVMACQKYKEVNKKYPTHIIIYRDGVGDGDLPYVVETEVVTIKKKLVQEIYKENDLKMAFVVVTKRINSRVFTDSKHNPPPGTIIDDVVTNPQRYDFLVIAQCVNQGTVSPTMYNVIFDEMGLPPDKMQMLTYKLCHVYFNWSGTVRVPAPVQYAHKLAFLTSQFLHRNSNRALENLLFFL